MYISTWFARVSGSLSEEHAKAYAAGATRVATRLLCVGVPLLLFSFAANVSIGSYVTATDGDVWFQLDNVMSGLLFATAVALACASHKSANRKVGAT